MTEQKIMGKVTTRQYKQLVQVLEDIYSHLQESTFPLHVIQTVSRLVPYEISGFNEVRNSDGYLTYVANPVGADNIENAGEIFQTYSHEHPLLNQARKGDSSAMKVTDYLTQKQFRKTGIYNEFYRQIGVQYVMSASLEISQRSVVAIAISRDRHDFSENDRDLLNLLRPHMARAYLNTKAISNLKNAYNPGAPAAAHLTARELEVAFWLTQGKTNGEMAMFLKISPRTVQKHLEHLYQKLEVPNRTAAAIKLREIILPAKN